jgi:aminoglycoside phosphotransferase family enzyme
MKKPVDFGFVDYTTLEDRRLACEAEVALTRRLCPDTYIGVQPIRDVRGRPRLHGEGRVLDYGVLMKRLAAESMLDNLLARDEVTESMIDQVAERLSVFHKLARRRPDVDAYGHSKVIRANWEENFSQTAPYIGRTITDQAFDAIRGWVTRWLDASEGMLRNRIAGGRICDGHGDVRSESICITDGICIFDCIEFSEWYRCCDVASEVAFLAVDLDARGRPDLGYFFAEAYRRLADDPELPALLPFYRCYRAYVRGKVTSFRLDEAEFSEAERDSAAVRGRSSFHLARRYAEPLSKPTLVLVAGLSGTGKTALARAIAGELGLRVISADAVRKSIFGPGGAPQAYGQGSTAPKPIVSPTKSSSKRRATFWRRAGEWFWTQLFVERPTVGPHGADLLPHPTVPQCLH